MKPNSTHNEKDDEIVPFIGIPRKWTNPAVKLYALLFLGYSGWISYQSLQRDSRSARGSACWALDAFGGFGVCGGAPSRFACSHRRYIHVFNQEIYDEGRQDSGGKF